MRPDHQTLTSHRPPTAGTEVDLRRPPRQDELAIVLGGGGARAAYQVGVLRWLARHRPDFRFPLITGVSAGAINAAYLASHRGSLASAAQGLTDLWGNLTADQVFRVDAFGLGRNVLRWGTRLVSGSHSLAPRVHSLVDTQPLDTLLRRTLTTVDGELVGIGENLERGALKALALSTLNYATGQTITWVQGCDIENWNRADRRSRKTRITIDHVMASAALPLVFPAIEVDGTWYGDGSIRLAAPLSPALHLGASRILTISTRYARSLEEADRPVINGYPPPAQMLGTLVNSIFLDVADQDARRLERLNSLLSALPAEKRNGLRPVELMVMRPSQDLGRLASDYEVMLPRGFRFLTRSLGTRETKSPDFLSLLLFQPDYLKRLIEIGEADAEARQEEILAFLQRASAEVDLQPVDRELVLV